MDQLEQIELMHRMSDKINDQIGFKATVEGGGACSPFLWITDKTAGKVVLFGDASNTWGGQIYPTQESAELGLQTEGWIETFISTDCHHVGFIIQGFLTAWKDRSGILRGI